MDNSQLTTEGLDAIYGDSQSVAQRHDRGKRTMKVHWNKLGTFLKWGLIVLIAMPGVVVMADWLGFAYYQDITDIKRNAKEVMLLGRIRRYCFPDSGLVYVVNGMDSETCDLWLNRYVHEVSGNFGMNEVPYEQG